MRPVLSYFIGWVVGKSRPKNDDTRRDQCRSSEDAKREQPPFVEMPSDMPSRQSGRACAASWLLHKALRVTEDAGRPLRLTGSATLHSLETQTRSLPSTPS